MTKIENVKIVDVSLNMSDHGCLVFALTLEGDGWAAAFGGWSLGHGYLGADVFEGSAKGLESLMQIMNTVGVDRWEDLRGKYCRAQVKDRIVCSIGNIITDIWFNASDFFKTAEAD